MIEFYQRFEHFQKLDCDLVFVSKLSQAEFFDLIPDLNLTQLDFPVLYFQDEDLDTLVNFGLAHFVNDNYFYHSLTLLLDSQNTIEYAEMCSPKVGRNPVETLRLLDSLLTGEHCQSIREPGDDTLERFLT